MEIYRCKERKEILKHFLSTIIKQLWKVKSPQKKQKFVPVVSCLNARQHAYENQSFRICVLKFVFSYRSLRTRPCELCVSAIRTSVRRSTTPGLGNTRTPVFRWGTVRRLWTWCTKRSRKTFWYGKSVFISGKGLVIDGCISQAH